MYIPQHFSCSDPQHLLEIMHSYSFACLMSEHAGLPYASHLPLLASYQDGKFTLSGHLARANPHWQSWQTGSSVLAVFQGPHTYVSPSNYHNPNQVPTWNYIAVHARGSMQLLHDAADKLVLLEEMIALNEAPYLAQFQQMQPETREKMLAAIVGFRLHVEHIEGKFKLSQHRIADEKPEMRTSHTDGNADQRAIAAWMQRLGYWS